MKKIRKIYFAAFILAILIGSPGSVCADNIEAKLPSDDGSDAFQVQDASGTAPDAYPVKRQGRHQDDDTG